MKRLHWFWKAVLAGLSGSIAHNVLFYLKTEAGILPSFAPYTELQNALTTFTGTNVHPAVPWLLSFLNGSVVLGPLFRLIYAHLPGNSGIAKGLSYGFMGWLVMSFVFLPAIGLGLFATNAALGAWPALLMLAMLLVYGAVMGAVLGWLR